ncbi:MAG: response regulator [Bdellovibrionaceae bacterium]|nr:response regulator [Pseudobdellovibrionaceae bacterium]
MSIINFIHRSPESPSASHARSNEKAPLNKTPQLISEEVSGVNDEFNQYMEYYMDMIRMKSKGCVLIVEDDEFCRFIIENSVKEYSRDIKIITSASVNVALEILKDNPCDLVIADYYLEGEGNGLDLCHKIVSLYPKTKCLMMSSMNFPQYQKVVAKADTSPEFMEKPIKPSLIKKYLTSFFEDLYF